MIPVSRTILHIGETIAAVVAEERFFAIAEATLRRERQLLGAYLARHPDFRAALVPLDVEPGAPAIVRRMAAAAAMMGVGPMAAVAGALAESAVLAMRAAGATHALVDNGGDIALWLDRPATVGIFTGDAGVRDIGFRVEPRAHVFGICTSSGRVGHSLSFGRAHAATVVAANVALADAAATALGNAVQTTDREALQRAMAPLLVDGIEGMLAVIDDVAVIGGELPALVKVHFNAAAVATIWEET